MGSQGKLKRVECLIIGALLAVAVLARLLPGERIVDDAYITFRYARNIVEGQGFVYNRGELVLGTTTPLYTLLLAGSSLLTRSRDFTAIAVVLNALAGAVSVGLLYAVGKRVANHWAPAAAAALLWAVAPYSVTFSVGGMETDLTITLLIAASYAYLSVKPRWMAVFSALAFLARPDTAILLGLLWLYDGLEQRQVRWQEGVIGLSVLTPWLIFGTLTFGSPIPGSIVAKSATYRLSPGEGLVRLIQHYSTPFFGHQVLGSWWQLAGFFLYFLLCSLGGLRAARRDSRVWPLLAYPFAYLTVFAFANPLLFRWYLSPPLPFYFLFILIGVWTVGQDVSRLAGVGRDHRGHLWDYQPAILAGFTAVVLAFTLNAWQLHPSHGPDRPAPEMAWFELELLYAQAARIVLDHAQLGDTLCAGDIGTLGYITDMPILDMVGLVTPMSRRHYPADPEIYVINYAVPADLILALNPDFIVILEVYGRRGLLSETRFQHRYEQITRIETAIYGSRGMLVFERTR